VPTLLVLLSAQLLLGSALFERRLFLQTAGSRRLAGDQGNDEGDTEEIPSGSSTPTLPHRQEDADLSAHHVHLPQTANGFTSSKASTGTRLVSLTEQVRASEFMAGHDDP
jgi:hypothetical protein